MNGVEDPMMTIEFLRVRLLSERSISKATKDRVVELAKRVTELEEQLKVVAHQRKRAEKATLDVLSYLDGLGVRDVSELYESDSDSNDEDSQCESNMDNDETTKDDKKFSLLVAKENDESASEPESTPSGRSLSWKGRKDNSRFFEKNRLHSSIRTRTTLAQISSSPRHSLGRSCRKIKRKEPRSTIEEARNESGISEGQGVNVVNGVDCLGSQDEALKKFPESYNKRDSEKEEESHSFQAQKSDATSYGHEHENSGDDMERALKHQAQLIRSYEAQEKAQRDWEEKYGDNNDSCEPGSHSDVTEERDENKATVSHRGEVDPCHISKTGTTTHLNSFKLSCDGDTGSSEKYNVYTETQNQSPTPNFAFSVANNSNQSWNVAPRHSVKHAGRVDPSQNATGPYKESAGVEVVLGALQEAKLLIKQQMGSLPETPNRAVDGLTLPVGCQSLFRVPTDVVDSAPSQAKFLNLDYSSAITNSTDYGKTLAVHDHRRYNSSSRSDQLFGTPPRQPGFDFHFDTNLLASSKSNLTSKASYPGFFPGLS